MTVPLPFSCLEISVDIFLPLDESFSGAPFSLRYNLNITLEIEFHISNYILAFSTNKGNSLCVLVLWGINGNTLCVLTPRGLHANSLCVSPCEEWTATNLFPWFEKLPRYDFLRVSSLVPNMVEGSASPLTYTWLVKSEVLPCLSHLVMIERVEERDGFSYCQFCLLLSSSDSPRVPIPFTGKY